MDSNVNNEVDENQGKGNKVYCLYAILSIDIQCGWNIYIFQNFNYFFYLFLQIIMMNITTESTQIHTTHKIHLINCQIVPMIFLIIYTKSNFRKDSENLKANKSPLTLGLIQVQRKSYKK